MPPANTKRSKPDPPRKRPFPHQERPFFVARLRAYFLLHFRFPTLENIPYWLYDLVMILHCLAWLVFGIGFVAFILWVLDCLGILAYWRERFFDD